MRQVIDQGPIEIAYGKDRATGIFLSVYDKRLEYFPGATAEVNKVCKEHGIKTGEGAYFDLHTGHGGFGSKVSLSTMATFLKRYGVPLTHIKRLTGIDMGIRFNAEEMEEEWSDDDGPGTQVLQTLIALQAKAQQTKPDTSHCAACNSTKSLSRCSRCKKVSYCNRECQLKDWSRHKAMCNSVSPFLNVFQTKEEVCNFTGDINSNYI